MPLKVYLAGTRHDPNLQAVKALLLEAGCELTSRWHELPPGDVDGTPEARQRTAAMNYDDLQKADLVVVSVYKEHHLRGAHVEVGFAIGRGIPVLTLGPEPMNTMTAVPSVHHLSESDEVRARVSLCAKELEASKVRRLGLVKRWDGFGR